MVHSPLNGKEDVYICNRCYEMVGDIFFETLAEDTEKRKSRKLAKAEHMTPSQIHRELNKYVIGQEHAKQVLSVAIYNHFKRINDKTGNIRKSNILLAGPSGCGKTHLVQTFARIIGAPLSIVSATSLTEAGYVGDDVEVCLQRLIELTNGDVKSAEKGIVFIDEIDKISRAGESRSLTRDVSGEGVQASLLKLIEGCEISVPVNGRRKHPNGQNVLFNTSNVLFIVGGAFEGLFQKTIVPHPIGFNTTNAVECISSELNPESLIQYGMMREFIGRFPLLVALDDLTEDNLVQILSEPDDSIIKEYISLFEKDGVELIFQDDFLHEIALLAMKQHTGARGLRSLLESTLLPTMYQLPDKKNVTRCIITKETITTKVPVLECSIPQNKTG